MCVSIRFDCDKLTEIFAYTFMFDVHSNIDVVVICICRRCRVSHEFISTERMLINKKKNTRQLLTECRHIKKIVFNLYTEYQITHSNVIGRQSLDVSVINVCSKERMYDSPDIKYIFYTIPYTFFWHFYHVWISILLSNAHAISFSLTNISISWLKKKGLEWEFFLKTFKRKKEKIITIIWFRIEKHLSLNRDCDSLQLLDAIASKLNRTLNQTKSSVNVFENIYAFLPKNQINSIRKGFFWINKYRLF